MTAIVPKFAADGTAAKLLDMTRQEFNALVTVGILPRPMKIGPHERWSVADLEAIADGKAAIPDQDIE